MLTTEVVNRSIDQIDVFKEYLTEYLTKHNIRDGMEFSDAYDSGRELMAMVTVLYSFFTEFQRKYGFILISYKTDAKIRALTEAVAMFRIKWLENSEKINPNPTSCNHLCKVFAETDRTKHLLTCTTAKSQTERGESCKKRKRIRRKVINQTRRK